MTRRRPRHAAIWQQAQALGVFALLTVGSAVLGAMRGFDLIEATAVAFATGIVAIWGRVAVPVAVLGLLPMAVIVYARLEAPPPPLATALMLAAALTASLLLIPALLRLRLGHPLHLRRNRDLLIAALIAGPLGQIPVAMAAAWLVADSIHGDAITHLVGSWLLLSLAGMTLFFTLLVAPQRPRGRALRAGTPLARLSPWPIATVMLVQVAGIGLWSYVQAKDEDRAKAAFVALVNEAENAISLRLASYRNAVNAGASYIAASQTVTRTEWRRYVEQLGIAQTYPGMLGLGVVIPYGAGQIDQAPAVAEALGQRNLRVHPVSNQDERFVITMIEPRAVNAAAVGLDLSFEPRRRAALLASRATGRAKMTQAVTLVQDDQQSAGFLLVKPSTIRLPDGSFRQVWAYAPFTAHGLLDDIAPALRRDLRMTVHDGPTPDPARIIYHTDLRHTAGSHAGHTPRPIPWQFTEIRQISAYGQTWTFVWHDVGRRGLSADHLGAALMLIGFAAASLLLTALLVVLTQREADVRGLVAAQTRMLSERDQRLRAILRTVHSAVLHLDDDSRILSINAAVPRLFGRDDGDLIGQPVSALIPGLDRAGLARLAATGAGPDGTDPGLAAPELTGRTASGQPLVLAAATGRWTGADGSPQLTLTLTDISARKSAERVVADAERRWDMALRSAGFGVFDMDLQTGRVVVSETWKSVMGFAWPDPDDPRRSAEWLARLHPDDLPRLTAAYYACLKGQIDRLNKEYRFQREDGTWIWTRAIAVITERGADGRARRMIGVQSDVTHLHEAEAQLRASEERFRRAFMDAPAGMVIVSRGGRFLDANHAFLEFSGYSQEDLSRLLFRDLIHPEDAARDVPELLRLRRGEIDSYAFEARFRHKDGAIRWGRLVANMERDANGVPLRFLSQIIDITEERELDQTKGDFIATVSHELRTPLTSILGALKLLSGLAGEALGEQPRRLLAMAETNSQRLLGLVNDLLEVERLGAEPAPGDRHVQPLRPLLDQAIWTNQPYARQFGATIELTAPDDPLLVSVDERHIQQIMANLLSNAAKFSPEGGLIRVVLTAEDHAAVVRVIDQGPGVPKSFRAKVFDRFTQADNSARRKRGGTGLGLHISRILTQQNGGTLSLAPDRDGDTGEGAGRVGAEFVLTLPLASAPAPQRKRPRGARAKTTLTPPADQPKP
ncbi:PAS domain S-box protein [Paracoccus sp. p4-l81]|uniref:PAS domain S-box protein n=1 Tax=Paracoccus sp. p4-l81 TaxID=3342806 RepID=UPI0035B7B7FC